MKKTVLLSIVVFAATALAANSNTFKMDLMQDSVIEGQTLKAGEYKVSFENGNAVIKQGKQTIEVPAREENVDAKFESNELTYRDDTNLIEAHFGGTHTKIVFEGAAPMNAGQ